jgi:hypothetical protein
MNEEPLKVRVEVEIRTPHAAELEKAISVDNVDVPQGITISVYHNEGEPLHYRRMRVR